MFIQFAVKNFLSFKEEAVFSLVSASLKERKGENTFKVSNDLELLKNAVICGANASGKSNLLKAMSFMQMFIYISSKETQSSELIKVERFKLNVETEKEPSIFEIVFMHNRVRYRYGFAVTEKEVVEEWLYYMPNKRELEVFTRRGQKFDLSRHFKSEESLVREKRIRPNALFLSVSAQFNGSMAGQIMEWFSRFNYISGIKSKPYGSVTLSLSKMSEEKKLILEFLKRADMGIEDFNIVETKVDNKKGVITQFNIKTVHKKYNSDGNTAGFVDFDMYGEESHGTKKFFELSGPIIDTLLNGKVLIIDELDSRLHPNLIRAICELFNSRKLNPYNAQLVFVSHNTNILDKDIMRRDQIWLVEKDRFGASELFSLVEFKDKKNGKKVRNDASYEKSYLKGIYGAVPRVCELKVKYGNG